MTQIDLNDLVRFTFTEAGAKLYASLPYPPVTEIHEGTGTRETELWSLMQIIGPGLYMGGPQLIVGNKLELMPPRPGE